MVAMVPYQTSPMAPQSSPNIVTVGADDNSQAMLMQAMLANMKPEDAAPIQAALAAAAKKAANRRYMRDTIRKLSPSLTNGIATQAYALNTPMTFSLTSTALNAYAEGLIFRLIINYTLAVGTSAVYGLTPTGKFALIDTIEVRYNKSQIKIRPKYLRDLALMGALDQYTLPDQNMYGQQDATLQAYLNTAMPVATGANSVTQEFFLPFNLLSPEDPRGVLPYMAGDTGIQVIVNTPLALFGTDSLLNAFYAISGTGHAVSAVSGTVAVEACYRDGDVYSSLNKLPFDIYSLDGTLQMQLDQPLNPLVAGAAQRTKLNIMGYHYYVLLTVIDGVASSAYTSTNNIVYLESSKDGAGGNTFWKYGLQTNMSVLEFFMLKRMVFHQDLDPGVIPMVHAPLNHIPEPQMRNGRGYLDNTRSGWADWRYAVQVTATGVVCPARIEPCVIYINPTGLVAV